MLIPPQEIPALPEKPLITHNDLDGLLSYLFLREKGYELAGIYDLDSLYMKPGVKPVDCLAVDLDISHPLIPSVGHHYTVFSEENHINMNSLFGVNSLERINNPAVFQKSFFAKCPIPTVLFLHWMTGTPLPKHPQKRAWLVYADSLHYSFTKYKPNVKNWLLAMGYEDLFSDLERGRLEPHFPSIVEMLASHGFKATPKKPFPQCKFSPAALPSLLPLVQDIARKIGYNADLALPAVSPTLKGTRYSFSNNAAVRNALQQKMKNWDLLSHGLIYLDHIEVTLLTPISAERDPILTAGLKERFGKPQKITA